MSVLFAPYRTVGHVVDSVPFHLKRLGTETFVTVTVGRAWQVYNVRSWGSPKNIFFFFDC
eukprot:83359-Amorphochlora_amoeboformis.AAC.1